MAEPRQEPLGITQGNRQRKGPATATGIDVGAGKNVIVNTGQLTVKAEAEAYGHSWAEEDAGDLADEDAKATARATSRAWGITTGNGNNLIVNNGSIIVTATAKPTAVAETEDNDVERRTPSGAPRPGGSGPGRATIVSSSASRALCRSRPWGRPPRPWRA